MKPNNDSVWIVFYKGVGSTMENECYWFNSREKARKYVKEMKGRINAGYLSQPVKYTKDF